MTSPASNAANAANPWTSYLDRFHDHRPGITEAVLSEACDVDAVVAEIHRVLRDDGTLVLLLPGSLPLGTRDRLRYVRLLATLREVRPAYPNSVHLGRLQARLERAGFAVVSDERRCFRYPIRDEQHAERFAESLYVPGRSPKRTEGAIRVARSWVGSTIGVPLRRVVCTKIATTTVPCPM